MQYSLMNYSCHAVHYIPRTYLFYNWKFIPFDPLHPFCPPPPPTSGNYQAVLCICEVRRLLCVCLCVCVCVCVCVFYDSAYKWHHTVFVFLWLISLNVTPSRSIHVVANVLLDISKCFFREKNPHLSDLILLQKEQGSQELQAASGGSISYPALLAPDSLLPAVFPSTGRLGPCFLFVSFLAVYTFPELDQHKAHNQSVSCSGQTLTSLELQKITVCPAADMCRWAGHSTFCSPFRDVLFSASCFPFSVANHEALVSHAGIRTLTWCRAFGPPIGTRAVSLQCAPGPGTLGSCFESRVVVVCEKMMSRACWAKSKHLIHSKTFRGMTLLHLAAAQGYATLIQTLIKWR